MKIELHNLFLRLKNIYDMIKTKYNIVLDNEIQFNDINTMKENEPQLKPQINKLLYQTKIDYNERLSSISIDYARTISVKNFSLYKNIYEKTIIKLNSLEINFSPNDVTINPFKFNTPPPIENNRIPGRYEDNQSYITTTTPPPIENNRIPGRYEDNQSYITTPSPIENNRITGRDEDNQSYITTPSPIENNRITGRDEDNQSYITTPSPIENRIPGRDEDNQSYITTPPPIENRIPGGDYFYNYNSFTQAPELFPLSNRNK